MFKVVIGGSREYENYTELRAFVDACLAKVAQEQEICIVSGGCRGTDLLGERYAAERGYAVERHPADWDRYGRSAGPRRNREMVDAADAVIAFWDGESRGTRSLVEYAQQQNKPLRIKKLTGYR